MGLSYDYISHRLQELFLPEEVERTVALHLGNGASACAIFRGVSVDTTMGLTPMEGLMMGTRSGSIDPGIPFYLETKGVLPVDIERELNHGSGLLGVSGLDSDLVVLEKAYHSGNNVAKMALSMFSRKAAQAVSQMATSMGGISCLVFAGGIGEHSALMRNWITRSCFKRRRSELSVRTADFVCRISCPGLDHFHPGRLDHFQGYPIRFGKIRLIFLARAT